MLQEQISSLSWNRTSFFSKFCLLFLSFFTEGLKITNSFDRIVKAEGYSALSSTCYSIAGTAKANLVVVLQHYSAFNPLQTLYVVWWCLVWLPLGAVCYLLMLPLSRKVVVLIGYDKMSPEQCDTRQSILRGRGYYEEAYNCIMIALDKDVQNHHTRGLLLLGLGRCQLHELNYLIRSRVAIDLPLARIKGDISYTIDRAIREADIAKEDQPEQAGRIFRGCAEILESIGEARASVFRAEAQKLVTQTGSNDQKLKSLV